MGQARAHPPTWFLREVVAFPSWSVFIAHVESPRLTKSRLGGRPYTDFSSARLYSQPSAITRSNSASGQYPCFGRISNVAPPLFMLSVRRSNAHVLRNKPAGERTNPAKVQEPTRCCPTPRGPLDPARSRAPCNRMRPALIDPVLALDRLDRADAAVPPKVGANP